MLRLRAKAALCGACPEAGQLRSSASSTTGVPAYTNMDSIEDSREQEAFRAGVDSDEGLATGTLGLRQLEQS